MDQAAVPENIEIIKGPGTIYISTINVKKLRIKSSTVNLYKDTGLIYKGYYFYSQEMNISVATAGHLLPATFWQRKDKK